MKKLRNILAVAGLCSLSWTAGATIIDHGHYLTDTNTGLDWLDVTLSVRMSYHDVIAQMTPGGAFEGWRYATGDELYQLVSGYTGVTSSMNYRQAVYTERTSPSVDGLVAMLGSTLDAAWLAQHGETWDAYKGFGEGEGRDYTWGILADENASNGMLWTGMLYDNEYLGPNDLYWIHHSVVGKGMKHYWYGSFLVRPAATVPEPASLVILGIGLTGLGFSRRKKLRTP